MGQDGAKISTHRLRTTVGIVSIGELLHFVELMTEATSSTDTGRNPLKKTEPFSERLENVELMLDNLAAMSLRILSILLMKKFLKLVHRFDCWIGSQHSSGSLFLCRIELEIFHNSFWSPAASFNLFWLLSWADAMMSWIGDPDGSPISQAIEVAFGFPKFLFASTAESLSLNRFWWQFEGWILADSFLCGVDRCQAVQNCSYIAVHLIDEWVDVAGRLTDEWTFR